LQALVFGAEDLAGDMGAIRTPDGWEGFYARSAVVLHAKAFGLQAIDTPFVHLGEGDADALIAETEQARYMGYDGKLAIHPKQVEPIQRIFTPTADEIAQAQALIAAYEAHQAQGTGVFSLGGKMIDMPMIRAAQAVIAKARAAGMIGED
jgi:citrate lyase beta subunit